MEPHGEHLIIIICLVDLPLIGSITLINHYVRKNEQSYLKEQYYLQPHPLELQLRNQA
jgi:uncharacterized protein YbgA (DUF1722 family)